MGSRTFTVTLTIRVSDEDAALEAAAVELVACGSETTLEAARAAVGGDLGIAVQVVYDHAPDDADAWSSIRQSECTEISEDHLAD